MPYPWLQATWNTLVERINKKQLPHALLITGLAGLGKRALAEQLVASLLCEKPRENLLPCGECRFCVMIKAHTHPDSRVLEPLEDKTTIGIDQVREVIKYLQLTSQYDGYKAIIIEPADSMNIHTSNALLKILEEPPANTLLILLTEHPKRLSATIRSRCQHIALQPPDRTEALVWLSAVQPSGDVDNELLLDLSAGAPLLAQQMAVQGDLIANRSRVYDDFEGVVMMQADPVEIAERCLKFDVEASLYWIESWIADLLRYKVGDDESGSRNPDLTTRLAVLAENLTIEKAFRLQDSVMDTLKFQGGQLNQTLQLERMFISFSR